MVNNKDTPLYCVSDTILYFFSKDLVKNKSRKLQAFITKSTNFLNQISISYIPIGCKMLPLFPSGSIKPT